MKILKSFVVSMLVSTSAFPEYTVYSENTDNRIKEKAKRVRLDGDTGFSASCYICYYTFNILLLKLFTSHPIFVVERWREVSHLLVISPNTDNSQYWDRLKPRAKFGPHTWMKGAMYLSHHLLSPRECIAESWNEA